MLNRPFRWGFSLFLLLVLGYFGLQIYRSVCDPFVTSVTYWYQAEDTVSATGWVVREEQVLPNQTGVLELTLAEGQRVGKGQTVARLYQSAQARSRMQDLAQKRSALEQLQQAQEALLDADSVLRLDGAIRQEVIALRQSLNRRDYADAETQTGTLKALTVRRSYAYGDEAVLQGRINLLREEIASLRTAAESGVSVLTAPLSGTYSAVTDGYESVLTPALLTELTPALLQTLTADPQSRSTLGRLILGDCWYYAAAVEQADALALEKAGKTLLRFAKGPDRDFAMTVELVGKPVDGQCVVVLRSDRYLAETTLLRHQSVDLVTASYAGLRVPTNAVQVQTKAVTDPQTGQSREERITGVYCVSGMTAYFKPVTPLYLGEDYYLVVPAGQTSARTLRAGDEIVVNARELYDGKVLG